MKMKITLMVLIAVCAACGNGTDIGNPEEITKFVGTYSTNLVAADSASSGNVQAAPLTAPAPSSAPAPAVTQIVACRVPAHVAPSITTDDGQILLLHNFFDEAGIPTVVAAEVVDGDLHVAASGAAVALDCTMTLSGTALVESCDVTRSGVVSKCQFTFTQ